MLAFPDRTKFVPLWRIFGDIFLEGEFFFLINKFNRNYKFFRSWIDLFY